MRARARLVTVTLAVLTTAALGAAVVAPATAAPLSAPGPTRDITDPTPPVIPAATWAAYHKAMIDSAVSEPREVVTNLILLDHSDGRVQWRTIGDDDYVLVSSMYYKPLSTVAAGEPFTVHGGTWIAIPGQLRDKCAANHCERMTAAQLDQRLKQLLGLPPDANYSTVNHFWARPEDMFRPCTDPRITSRSCPQLTVTGEGVPTTVGATNLALFLWAQADYAWRIPDRFDPRTAKSCAFAFKNPVDCYGFPWTRLGYTYDWTDDNRDVGVTEFVVVDGATVYMDGVGSQRDFFPAS